MRDFEPHKPNGDIIEIKGRLTDAEQKKTLRFIGSYNLQKGHRFWKLLPEGDNVVLVKEDEFMVPELSLKVVSIAGRNTTINSVSRTIKEEKGCWYTGALNKENAQKKFKRAGLLKEKKENE